MSNQPLYQSQMKSMTDAINRKPNLVACIQAFNEQDFIGLNLQNHFDVFDRIIVIEGSVGQRADATSDGHSTDLTASAIKDFKEKHDNGHLKKMMFLSIKRAWKSLEEIKNTFLQMASPHDIICIIDADEFYQPQDIERIRIAADRYPHIISFQPTMLHLYRDFAHIYTPGPEWGSQHERCYRFLPGMKYDSHPVVSDKNGRSLYFSPEYITRRASINNLFIWHYGYSRSNMKDVMARKLQYYRSELAKHGDAVAKFEAKYNEFMNGTESPESILAVSADDQPSIMRQHLMFGYKDPLYDGKSYKNWLDHALYGKVARGEPHELVWNCMKGLSSPYMNYFSNEVTIS